MAKLREKLEKEDNKRVVTWSNGNIFRSVTLLASTWCEQQTHCDGFDAEQALTKENLANFMNMLKFGKYNGKFDTRICGLGLDLLVSEVENTELKAPKVRFFIFYIQHAVNLLFVPMNALVIAFVGGQEYTNRCGSYARRGEKNQN